MTLLSVDGVGALPGSTVTFSLWGPSVWNLVLTGDRALSGAVVAETDDGQRFSLGVKQSGVGPDTVVRALAFGGAAGLDLATTPECLVGATRREAIVGLLALAGERLAEGSAVELDERLDHFVRPAQPVGDAIRSVVPAGMTMRSTADGEMWVGAETWSTSALEDRVMKDEPNAQQLELQPQAMKLFAGETFQGRRITEVVYTLGKAGWKAVASYRVGAAGVRGELQTFIRRTLGSQLPYLEISLYRVVIQAPDGTLDLEPINDAKDPPLQRVPIVMGAGMTVKVFPGTLAHVTYENGSPFAPRVIGFGSTPAQEIKLDALSIKAGGELFLVTHEALQAWVAALTTALATPSPSKTVPPLVGAATLVLRGG